jgi:hypothetical protein
MNVPPREPAAAKSAPLSRSAAAAVDAGPASQSNVLGLGLLPGQRVLQGRPRWRCWGETASSDLLRRSFRCLRCGGKGATLMLPSHVGGIGQAPFPVER